MLLKQIYRLIHQHNKFVLGGGVGGGRQQVYIVVTKNTNNYVHAHLRHMKIKTLKISLGKFPDIYIHRQHI